MYHKATAIIALTLLSSLKALVSLLSSESKEDLDKAKKEVKKIEKELKTSEDIPEEIKEKVSRISVLLGDEDKTNDPEAEELKELLSSLQKLNETGEIRVSDELKSLYRGIIDSEKFEMNEQNTDTLISSMFNIDPKDVRNISALNITPTGLISKALMRSESGQRVMDMITNSIPVEKKIDFSNKFIDNMGGINQFLIALLQTELGDENSTSIEIMDKKIEFSRDAAKKARGDLIRAAAKTMADFGVKGFRSLFGIEQ